MIYLCGPMSGHPHYNYPAFNAEAARLRALGYEVENPADNPEQAQWSDYMRAALTQMMRCDRVAVLPGFDLSRGAMIEVRLAFDLGMPVVRADSIK